jgi:hypothetical protein
VAPDENGPKVGAKAVQIEVLRYLVPLPPISPLPTSIPESHVMRINSFQMGMQIVIAAPRLADLASRAEVTRMSRLVVNPDSPEAWPIELQPGSISLGRSEENDVLVEHPSVSSSHCRITVADAGTWLKDLGSTSGTFVNDELVEEARLRSGQTIRLGEVVMRFESEAIEDNPTPSNPPVPPRVAPLSVTASDSRCKFHPQTPARFACAKCHGTFCDLCVATRHVQGTSRPFCRHCGTECQALQPRLVPDEPTPDFVTSLPRALLYPFQGNGVILLTAGTAFFYILGYLPLVGVILTGYLFAYAKSIITTTAEGRKDPPDWPEFSDWKEDILVPYVQLLALVVLCFGPALIIGVWRPGTETEARIAYLTALGFGVFFAPMGMLALAMFDTLAVLNPIALTWPILRAPLHYLVAAVAFEGVFLLYWFFAGSLRARVPVPFLPDLISSFLNLYLISVGMRILGLLYVSNQDKFGWFNRLRR